MGGHVYILASEKRGTIDIGLTADLSQRVYDHRVNWRRNVGRRPAAADRDGP
jgi:predicted GIY-YIG superfamily endonuclease